MSRDRDVSLPRRCAILPRFYHHFTALLPRFYRVFTSAVTVYFTGAYHPISPVKRAAQGCWPDEWIGDGGSEDCLVVKEHSTDPYFYRTRQGKSREIGRIR